jgi:transcriptional regulator with XRE-family HTH domain
VSSLALKLLLAFCGATQASVAKKAGINKSQLSAYVKERRPIPNKHRLAIIEALELTPRAWGFAEDLAERLLIELRRFEERHAAMDKPYGDTEPRRSDVAGHLGWFTSAFDPETIDEITTVLAHQTQGIGPGDRSDSVQAVALTASSFLRRPLLSFLSRTPHLAGRERVAPRIAQPVPRLPPAAETTD